MNPFQLDGKKIIVTGAASGIGRDTVKLLHELGAKCIMLDINEEGLAETNHLISDAGLFYVCDLTEFDSLQKVFQAAKEQVGQFDGVVHCAGIPSVVPLRGLTSDIYEKVQKINTQAGLQLAKCFSRRGMYNGEGRCSVVFISSVYGLVGSVSNVAYAVSKAANIGMTKALAMEFAPKGIRVNCVAPGFVKTPMGEKYTGFLDEAYAERIGAMHPLGWGEPRDISCAIAFLLSDAAKWITGTVLSVDGGFTAQ